MDERDIEHFHNVFADRKIEETCMQVDDIFVKRGLKSAEVAAVFAMMICNQPALIGRDQKFLELLDRSMRFLRAAQLVMAEKERGEGEVC